jgi:GntR family transcriptional regulator/MocR family aminotransferase
VEPGTGLPLYLQVAKGILDAIQTHQFRPGMALPSVRELAERTEVTINTILAALRELQAQGWLVSLERSGFFVADPLPQPSGSTLPGASALAGFDLPGHLQPVTATAGVRLDLTEGLADARLAPFYALGRAYQRGLRIKGATLMGSRDPLGLPRLREALAEHLGSRHGGLLEPGRILILRSSTMAVTLVGHALLGAQGGVVAVEDPGQPHLWQALRQASPAELRGLPVDSEGLVVPALEALLRATPIKLLVLTPQCHYPTGARLPEARRARILALAREHRFPILELDTEQDYLPASLPMAAMDPGQVLYVGSLSRIFAPGLRMAFLVVPAALATLLARARQSLDWQGDPGQEWALSELFLDGEIQRQILRLRKAAGERSEAVQAALRLHLGDQLTWRAGPMALWLEGTGALASPPAFGTWIKACQAQGLKLRSGNYYRLDGQEVAASRLGFTAFTPEELTQAVALMG